MSDADPADPAAPTTAVGEAGVPDASDLEWFSPDPDEEVIWAGQPAFETLYGTIATGLVLAVVLIGFLILLAVPLSYLGIRNTDYVVTTKSLYVKSGVLSTNIETVDLHRIQNTEYSQSFWGKRFGYGRIAISTAGSSGAEITFKGIPDAKAVRDRIAELQTSRGRRGDDGTAGGRGSGERGDAAAQPASADRIDELIAEMRATREAFERIERHVTAAGEGGDAGGQVAADDAGETPTDDAGETPTDDAGETPTDDAGEGPDDATERRSGGESASASRPTADVDPESEFTFESDGNG
ncbi:MAG: PH domain-containing protein [Haloferacaceae archaeon]